MTRLLLLACLVTGLAAHLARADSWSEKHPDFRSKKLKKRGPGPGPGSPLEDNDILIGIKGGVQFNSFTDKDVNGQSDPVTNGTGYAAGASLYWNVGLPRLELDVLLNTRKQGNREPVSYIGLPALVKFNVAENKLLTWEVGTGIQTDLAVGGGSTRRGVLIGLPVATDLLIELFDSLYGTFELRYDFGMLTYDGGTTGGRPRDLSILFGLALPIDRTGF